MKKYVCPMECLTESQDQLVNCPEYGMKLLEMQTERTSRRLGRQYVDHADFTQMEQESISAKSAFNSASSAFLYFISLKVIFQ
jgi:hypothetical protein